MPFSHLFFDQLFHFKFRAFFGALQLFFFAFQMVPTFFLSSDELLSFLVTLLLLLTLFLVHSLQFDFLRRLFCLFGCWAFFQYWNRMIWHQTNNCKYCTAFRILLNFLLSVFTFDGVVCYYFVAFGNPDRQSRHCVYVIQILCSMFGCAYGCMSLCVFVWVCVSGIPSGWSRANNEI